MTPQIKVETCVFGHLVAWESFPEAVFPTLSQVATVTDHALCPWTSLSASALGPALRLDMDSVNQHPCPLQLCPGPLGARREGGAWGRRESGVKASRDPALDPGTAMVGWGGPFAPLPLAPLHADSALGSALLEEGSQVRVASHLIQSQTQRFRDAQPVCR